MYSDAAGVHGVYATVFGSNWFTDEWLPAMQPFHITIKELFPIVLAVEIWGNALTNHKILFFTDNAAVVDIINNTTSKDKVIMKLVRRLALTPSFIKVIVFVLAQQRLLRLGAFFYLLFKIWEDENRMLSCDTVECITFE